MDKDLRMKARIIAEKDMDTRDFGIDDKFTLLKDCKVNSVDKKEPLLSIEEVKDE